MRSFYRLLGRIGSAVGEFNRRRRRGCRLWVMGCLSFVGLLLILFLLLLFIVIDRAGAMEAPPREDLTVQLVIDNSNSMFDRDGVGSDPELLRMAAARLFIEYLGVDDGRFHPLCGIIFFGTDARLMSPPVPLAGTSERTSLIQLLGEPERQGWTDHLEALEAARRGLDGVQGRRAIILLTDGKPEWSEHPTPREQADYLEGMDVLGRRLIDEQIALFIILLAGPGTDLDPEVQEVWQPMWEDMATMTSGRFQVARDAQDLPATYHDVVIALTGRQSEGAVIDGMVAPGGLREVVNVESGLARLMLVVRKSHKGTAVTIRMPDGTVLGTSEDTTGSVHREGGLLEEIWTIQTPAPGAWTVTADGEGRLTVWKDYEMALPTPFPPTATPIPVATASPAATESPVPEIAAGKLPGEKTTPAVVEATMEPQPTPSPAGGNRGRGTWVIFGLLVALAGGAGGYLMMGRRGRQPVVSGTLHLLDGNGQDPRPKSIDLYQLHKKVVTIGAGESDVHLQEPSDPVVLSARRNAAGETEIIASSNPDVTLNGSRLLTDQTIYDGDLFVIGRGRIRYEDLQRRRPRKKQTSRRNPYMTDLNPNPVRDWKQP